FLTGLRSRSPLIAVVPRNIQRSAELVRWRYAVLSFQPALLCWFHAQYGHRYAPGVRFSTARQLFRLGLWRGRWRWWRILGRRLRRWWRKCVLESRRTLPHNQRDIVILLACTKFLYFIDNGPEQFTGTQFPMSP